MSKPAGPVESHVTGYLDALARGDRAAAWLVVERLTDAGASPLEVMSAVIAPAQRRIGQLWATDEWSVAQEHAATAVTETVLARLGARIPSAEDLARPVVVTCVEQEWHALPALLVAEHLRDAGLAVSYLGANASAEHLVRHVHDSSARAVALSCSLSSSLLRVRHQVEAVRATGTPVLVGGAAFDPAGRRATVLGANAFAATGAEAAEAVAGLPEAVPPAPVLQHAGAPEAASVHADREQLVLSLRRRLDERTRGTEATPAWAAAVRDHLPQLVGALAGGLVVDDPSVLEETAGWLDEVLAHRDAPTGTVAELLTDLGRLVSELPAAHALVSEVTRRRAA